MAELKNEEKTVLEAGTVFLLMKRGFPISRNVRAQWMLEHLDSVIEIQQSNTNYEDAPELEVVSVLPNGSPASWSADTSHQFLYKVLGTTSIIFLAHKYRMVFSLDLSPSLATIDIQHGAIVIDEVYLATKIYLERITRPFTIPGSKRILQPEIFVTVIAHTPFLTSPAQQVLVQGWLLTANNVNSLIQHLEKQLNLLEEKVSFVAAIANQQLETLKAENERLVGGLFEDGTSYYNKNNNCVGNTAMILPEGNFINMLRYGMLALTLLPEHSCAHLIIITDGIVSTTDVHLLDSIMQQLRATTVACSFVHVGSMYHPHCADGLIPYQDLLCFLAAATLGSYMTYMPQIVPEPEEDINIYHKNIFCWQLYRDTCNFTIPTKQTKWHSNNTFFYGHKPVHLLRKKQIDDQVTCTLSSLLCCRLREGYLIKRATIRDDILEICFVLLWKSNVFLEHLVTCPWSSKSLSVSNTIQYTITIEAPYEFLHDITCLSKKPLKSQYRQGVVSRFWVAIKSLTESDNMLAHFSWFPGSGWSWYNIPDTIRSGMPVFNLSAHPVPNTLQLSDAACPQFGQIWHPVVSMEIVQWARWMHTQRITLLLSHDRPLPKYLHQANQNGRFQWIQCRQAAAVLYAMLKTWATFVLVENHTYVQFIYKEVEKPPVAFSLIRVNCKALCVVLNIAFTGGTEGGVRHNVVVDLIERLSQLTLPNRPMEYRETLCCTVIHKPLEKILIRYERIPTDPSTIVFPDNAHTNSSRNSMILTNNHTTTLSRYLYHNRWLWHVKRPFVHIVPGITLPRLNITAIARILSTITKMRLEEGFYFAYSAAGIISMVLEVNMQGLEKNSEHFPCIIQYILFPPQVVLNNTLEADQSDEDTDEGTVDGDLSTDDCEGSGDFQIITEIWIEPQYGHVGMLSRHAADFLHSLQYHQLPDAIARIDEECVNALLTLEYLSQLCQVSPIENGNEVISGQGFQTLKTSDRSVDSNGYGNSAGCFKGSTMIDERIHHMHFTFDALSILPKCQQGELIFSMFANGTDHVEEGRQTANRILMEGFLKRVKHLHNKELHLTNSQSQKFTEMLFNRPRDEDSNSIFFSKEGNKKNEIPSDDHPHWRCFVKGISSTHVIMTILPASEKDVYLIALHRNQNEKEPSSNDKNCSKFEVNEMNCSTDNSYEKKTIESFEQSTSDNNTNSNRSNTPVENITKIISSSESLLIPVYVYNCSLTLLIDALIEKLESPRNKDIYQDHTFRIGQKDREEFMHSKLMNNMKTSSPEPKSEDSDNATSDQKSLMEHCKILNFAHCHCYVAAVYKSLALQQPLSYEDMEAAVELCEESLIEIDITNYLQSVCRHLSISQDGNSLSHLNSNVCCDVKPLHDLIKDKFESMITVAFRPVPAHPEFYYCSPLWLSKKTDRANFERSDDSDDDFTFHSEIDCKLDDSSRQENEDGEATGSSDFRKLPNCAYSNNELQDDNICDKEQPLFLRLSCSIYFRSGCRSTLVNLLPTCLNEIIQRMDVENDDAEMNLINLTNIKVTLGIICLNLPREVVDVTAKRCINMKNNLFFDITTDNVHVVEYERSLSDEKKSENLPDSMKHLPLHQHSAITNLTYEIEWLLQDETATALLDRSPPTEKTLKFVARHVSESTERTSCSMDKVPLHFVFPSENSVLKFLEELQKLKIDRYCIQQEGFLYYFIKNTQNFFDEINDNDIVNNLKNRVVIRKDDNSENIEQNVSGDLRNSGKFDTTDPPGCYSDISSIGEGKVGTDDGYEGDSSNSEDDLQWLIELDKRRDSLPNFWLILQVESSHVNVYFHCRFLELVSPEVDCYKLIQKMVVNQIKVICRRVNQYLLLQKLHDTRACDKLLEPEVNEDHVWRGDTSSDSGGSLQSNNSILNFAPGMFRCPVVWEVPFYLHPRLKTGPGRSGLSRGIKAFHGVLNWLSVYNRDNMFVYQENNKNVFYLRLHEQTNDGKPLQNKLSESDEKLTVSRSNSAASLSQAKGIDSSNDHSLANDTRPRVRSFGEKESDILNKAGDSIILKVHGISEAGPLVKCDLVQVLQNRLDDAVFEVLSVMLARNPMCKLTPADVHFIQKPYKNPETIVQLSVQSHCLLHMAALGHYLRQNLLQFLYIPKYTDHRTCYHFQDYSQPEGSPNRVAESDIFLYNQSPSSGSKGIACIALAIADSKNENIRQIDDDVSCDTNLREQLKSENFENLVSTSICTTKSNSKQMIEFRIWKQGRVNLDALLQKLCAAVKYATWDLVTEYNLLSTALTEPLENIEKGISTDDKETPVENKPIQSKDPDNIVINQYEFGEEGKLNEIYHTILTKWFKYALEVGVPAVKKHEVIIHHRHSIPVIVRELQNLIRGHAPDTSSRAFVLRDRQPFLSETVTCTPNLLAFCENTEARKRWVTNVNERERTLSPVYVSCDFSKHEQGTYTNCILIARNFYQWKVSFGKTIEEELLVPKDQKLLQKFNPLILPSDFIPRQRILLAEIQSGNITFYMYNWSKERSEKFIKQTTSLGTWLSSRSQLFTNIIMHKLGIFHHQPTTNYQQSEQSNSQYYQITDMESLTKFPHSSHGENKSVSKQHTRNNPLPWNQLVGQSSKETENSAYHLNDDIDPVVKTAYDLQDFRHRERKAKEDMNKLYTIWQNRSSASNIPVCCDTLNTFKQHSRLIHFCHTPLLFLPTWRLQSAATRDHSLTPPCSLASSNVSQQTNEQIQLKEDPSKAVIVKWHRELCNSMLTEYKQYLQILGFSPIQVESQDKMDTEQTPHQTHYLKKSMLGGVLLFEIHLSQPFFIAKLRVIECNRLSTKTNSAMVNQFVLSFVDACDKIKINMHLHSFTYDFHLRCIHSYIAGKGFWSLQQGYHLTHFLDDFNKYYSKAPNYARNLVYSDVINVRNLATPARMLYTYLLAHEETYGMRAFVMSNEPQESQEGEYVLFKLQSTPLVSYCDAQDTRYTDDFDVALIVSRIEQSPEIEKTEITLKYYLMLTSKRELYPKRDLENNKLGKFRTVYSVIKLANSSQPGNSSDSNSMSTFVQPPPPPPLVRKSSNREMNNPTDSDSRNSDIDSNGNSKESDEKISINKTINNMAPTPPPVPNSPLTQNHNILNTSSSSPSPHLVQIRQESVNYLGYYSSHEQLMQQLIMSQAQAARQHIIDMIERGASQCRTHLLWNKLFENKSSMTYTEFMELCSLAHVEPLSQLEPRISPLSSQPVSWYQTLTKVLQNKYQEFHKQFSTADGNITHHLILHHRSLQAFTMLTIDLHTSRGDLYVVYRKLAEVTNAPVNMEDVYSLIEGFINACCFHLWTSLCNQ
ncbi:KICSTOR complex protein SZT2-like isoform X1 [Polistes fuscatus]|uniref:KICSTOR complex protein SZT2-like isoform X1 n=1 Tax=Polistes fuscatus TaxID=30207 RepID=UPI001CA87769|nr:KICSTOR complex protein SZT2-like isoform X1 [Polistes fuscatus]